MSRGRIVALLVLASVPSARLARAEEDAETRNTQEPAPPPERSFQLEAGGLAHWGDQRRVRELWRLPVDGWAVGQLQLPFTSRFATGELDAAISTFGTGWARLHARLADGSEVRLRVRRDRAPFTTNGSYRGPTPAQPVPSEPFTNLELSHEQVELNYLRWIRPLDGLLEVGASYDHRGGDKPSLVNGLDPVSFDRNQFGNPSRREVGDHALAAFGSLTAVAGGARLRGDVAFRQDFLGDTLLVTDRVGNVATGGFGESRTASRQTVEAGLSVETAGPARLLAGGSYRFILVRSQPSERRQNDLAPTDVRLRVIDTGGLLAIYNRLAVGALWLPIPEVRVAARLEAASTVLSDQATEVRDRETFQVSQNESRYRPWSGAVRVDAAWAPLRRLWIEAEGALRLLSGTDRWSQMLFLADRTTLAAQRVRDVDRDRIQGRVEGRIVSPLTRRLRLIAGYRWDRDHWGVDTPVIVDTFTIGDRDRSRQTVFLIARVRVNSRFSLDARGVFFDETYDLRGTESSHRGWDARLSATATIRRLALFGAAAFTDDRYRLSPTVPAAVVAGFAPLDFVGQSWFALAGATLAIGRGHSLGATYTLALNTEDLRVRLQDASLRGTIALPHRLRLGLTARYLWFHDSLATWSNAQGLMAMASFGGSF